jgi:hypothetical protein
VKLVSDEDISKAKKDVTRFCTEWRKRKRACNEILDQICESADLKKKDFMESIGLEADEEVGVNINDYINL